MLYTHMPSKLQELSAGFEPTIEALDCQPLL